MGSKQWAVGRETTRLRCRLPTADCLLPTGPGAAARSVTFSAKALFYDAGEGNEDTATVCAGRPELISARSSDSRP